MVVCALLSRQHRTARGGCGATASAPAPTTANTDFGHIAEATDHKPDQSDVLRHKLCLVKAGQERTMSTDCGLRQQGSRILAEHI